MLTGSPCSPGDSDVIQCWNTRAAWLWRARGNGEDHSSASPYGRVVKCALWNIHAFQSSSQRRCSSWPRFGGDGPGMPVSEDLPLHIRSTTPQWRACCGSASVLGQIEIWISYCSEAPKSDASTVCLWIYPVGYHSNPWPIKWKNESLGVVFYLEPIKAIGVEVFQV